MTEDGMQKAMQHAAFIVQGGPSLPPTCVLCGTTYPKDTYEFGSIVSYGQPDDGFHCRKCTDPIALLSGCEACSKPLGPIPCAMVEVHDDGWVGQFHPHCIEDLDHVGCTITYETHGEMLVRWASDLKENAEYQEREA